MGISDRFVDLAHENMVPAGQRLLLSEQTKKALNKWFLNLQSNQMALACLEKIFKKHWLSTRVLVLVSISMPKIQVFNINRNWFAMEMLKYSEAPL